MTTSPSSWRFSIGPLTWRYALDGAHLRATARDAQHAIPLSDLRGFLIFAPSFDHTGSRPLRGPDALSWLSEPRWEAVACTGQLWVRWLDGEAPRVAHLPLDLGSPALTPLIHALSDGASGEFWGVGGWRFARRHTHPHRLQRWLPLLVFAVAVAGLGVMLWSWF